MSLLAAPTAVGKEKDERIEPLDPKKHVYWPKDGKSLVDKSLKVAQDIDRPRFSPVTFNVALLECFLLSQKKNCIY